MDTNTPIVNLPTGQNSPTEQEEKDPFDALPRSIIEHLNSSETLAVLYDLENRFRIGSDKVRVIPVLLSSIVTGDLESQAVVPALVATLGVSEKDAISIAGSIKDRILNPIAGGLLLVMGIDIEPIPGPSARDAKDLPALTEELAPYLAQIEGQRTDEKRAPTMTGVKPKSAEQLEPLVVGQRPAATVQAQPKVPGMETPGLRTMKDVKPPVIELKKPEPVVEQKPQIVSAPKPFMLHEEKPVAPSSQPTIKTGPTFSFEVQPQTLRQAQKPVTASLNPSFEEMLEPKKTPVAPIAKTVETPKVVHYTSMRTPLSDEKPKN